MFQLLWHLLNLCPQLNFNKIVVNEWNYWLVDCGHIYSDSDTGKANVSWFCVCFSFDYKEIPWGFFQLRDLQQLSRIFWCESQHHIYEDPHSNDDCIYFFFRLYGFASIASLFMNMNRIHISMSLSSVEFFFFSNIG